AAADEEGCGGGRRSWPTALVLLRHVRPPAPLDIPYWLAWAARRLILPALPGRVRAGAERSLRWSASCGLGLCAALALIISIPTGLPGSEDGGGPSMNGSFRASGRYSSAACFL